MIQWRSESLPGTEASTGLTQPTPAVTRVAGLLAAFAFIIAWGCSPAGPSPAQGAPVNARISADPNPVPPGPGLGKTTITWSTGSYSAGQVYVLEDGGGEQLFGHESNWSSDAPWIRTGSIYEFRLYAGTDRKNLLGKVVVTRDAG